MMLRTHVLRVRKGKEKALLQFMKLDVPRMLRKVPGCRVAYFARSQKNKREFIWVSLWTSKAAWKNAPKSTPDWKKLGVKEKAIKFQARPPRNTHYDLILTVR